jgi:hypothetical protein
MPPLFVLDVKKIVVNQGWLLFTPYIYLPFSKFRTPYLSQNYLL